MHVLHTITSLDERHGGPSRSVRGLAAALAQVGGMTVSLYSQRLGVGIEAAANHDRGTPPNALGVHIMPAATRIALALGLPIRRALASAAVIGQPRVLHAHGIWQAPTHWLAKASRDWHVPLIVQPRGMLEPWALGQKPLKKRLALTLFQRHDLESAHALVATSEMEAENLRRFGLAQPVAVIPNGIDFELLCRHNAPAQADDTQPRTALFLSRVHPKKGVRELVTAWSRVRPSGWRLRIAGPDEGGYWSELRPLVDQWGLADSIEHLGPVEGSAKAAVFHEADLFVLPTFSENFGLVVAEALACGVPVITTRGAPWADLETHGCGWWIDTGVAPLEAALRTAMALPDDERRRMGERGRAYVQRYKWADVAAQTAALYRWLLGQGDRPDCVRLQ